MACGSRRLLHVWPRGRRLSRPPGGRNSGLGAPARVLGSEMSLSDRCPVIGLFACGLWFGRRGRPLAVRWAGLRVGGWCQLGTRGVPASPSRFTRSFAVRCSAGSSFCRFPLPQVSSLRSSAVPLVAVMSVTCVVYPHEAISHVFSSFSRGPQGWSEDLSARCQRHHFFPPGAPG